MRNVDGVWTCSLGQPQRRTGTSPSRVTTPSEEPVAPITVRRAARVSTDEPVASSPQEVRVGLAATVTCAAPNGWVT